MENNPLVSILIPNYNKAPYLRGTLDSVLAQTYPNWECIVVDDHSTDNSWEILKEYAKKDFRIKIFKRPENRKKGGNVARNYAFEMSNGDFVQWLDSDDVIHPEKIQSQLNNLLMNDQIFVSISNWDWFDSQSKIENTLFYSNFDPVTTSRWINYPSKGLSLILWLFKNNLFIPSHAYFMNRRIVLQSGLWQEDINKNQDGEFMLRVLLKGGQVVFNDSVYAFYRRPDSTHLSKQATLSSYQDWFRSLELGDEKILAIKDSKEIRDILVMNYERLIKYTGLEFPTVTEMSSNRIKELKPSVKFDFSKPFLIWLSGWIGFKNFLKFRTILIRLKLIAN
ncbi:glycosyltransferase family 2 protein [uncultured Algoriphagus sp.]|uniref:glycosyltransferase family 2 protein n=1 Tax=uncultured Algoriphagus sp. TaxID=417365 RepID=UPI002586E676|nr:glycosyltransferase family 2 protein [uncultured Algoriphagus sp.]